MTLYHTKNYQGTTTVTQPWDLTITLYHTKNYQGTTTRQPPPRRGPALYHTKNYQGTTTMHQRRHMSCSIIPYQELPGNYNVSTPLPTASAYYTIPRTTRELQHADESDYLKVYYTIPRTTRELQPIPQIGQFLPIIPYQELPGNYNWPASSRACSPIIPYQELPGNYNAVRHPDTIVTNYTIPRTTRELQLLCWTLDTSKYYTIPRTTRELQRHP